MASRENRLISGSLNRRRSPAVPKQERRDQLIKATIKCVARNGLAGTTMADVTQQAGLSLGIVNLHFQSKEKLLIETLRYVAEEYRATWKKALVAAHPDPIRQLEALLEVDFGSRLSQRNNIAIWFAFWGEAKSRPMYQRICASYDAEYDRVVLDLCAQAIEDGGYPIDASCAAHGLTALCNGLWLDILLNPRQMPRDEAQRICMSYLRTMFPHHG